MDDDRLLTIDEVDAAVHVGISALEQKVDALSAKLDMVREKLGTALLGLVEKHNGVAIDAHMCILGLGALADHLGVNLDELIRELIERRKQD